MLHYTKHSAKRSTRNCVKCNMIKYEIEKDTFNIILVDEEYGIKTIVAVAFDDAHARIIKRKLNEYVHGSVDLEEALRMDAVTE